MIHWVVALRPEAEPLIDRLRLNPVGDVDGLEVFEAGGSRLIVSGVGRWAAAEATGRLHDIGGGKGAVWLNIGLAAHRERAIGDAVVAHKIVEAATGRCWFPQLVVEPTLPTATLCTVDRAVETPLGERVYEMEASGFLATALRHTTAELVSCVKIISDHGLAPGNWLSPGTIAELVARNADEAIALARALETLSERLPGEDGEEMESILGRWHFTVTQRRQLGGLARRAAALGSSLTPLIDRKYDTSRQALRGLQQRVDELASTAPLPEQES